MFPILCYHKVGPVAEEGRWLNVEPHTLRSHIRFLKRRGYRFVRARELALLPGSGAACLTFDDAYVSTLTHGLEILRSEEVTASIYAVADLVGETSVWDEGRARPLASWAQLRAAAEMGFEIGNHTDRHPALATLGVDTQRDALDRAHRQLNQEGIIATSVAYPYGSHDAHTKAIVKQAGYGVGLALSRRMAAEQDDRLALPRIVVACGDSPLHLAYKMWIRPRLPMKPKPNFID